MSQDRPADLESRRTETAVLVLIVALAAFLRLYRLDYQSLWYDEAYTASVTNPATVGLSYIWSSGPVAVMPPLHHTLVYLSRLLGTGETSLRLPSVLAGILTVMFIYLTARYCFNRRVAAFAALIGTVSTFHVYYSQEARAYSLLMLLSVASTYFLVRALREKRQVWWLLHIASSALGLYTHLYMAFVLLAQNVYLLMEWEAKRVSGRAWVVSQVVPFLLFSPWLLTYAIYYKEILLGPAGAFERATRDYWMPLPDATMLTHTVGLFFVGFFDLTPLAQVPGLGSAWLPELTWIQEAIPRLVAPYLLLAAIALWRLRHDSALRGYGILFALLLLLPLALMSAISLQTRILNPRYFSFAYPYFCVLLALGIDTFNNRATKTVLLAIVIAVNAVGLANGYFNPAFQRDPWRQVAGLLQENARPSDAVLVCCTESQIALNYYYAASPAPTGLPIPFQGVQNDGWPYLQAIMAGRTRAWLVVWSDFGLADVYANALRGHCEPVGQPDFKPIGVDLYESCAP
jgi:mannosyltransferase